MKWKILHESKGRMRLHLNKPRMSLAEADQLQDYLAALPGVRTAAVYERTCDVVVVYTENRASLVKGLVAFRFDVEALAEVPANSPRAVNREYQEKLVNMTIFHLARKLFLPMPLRIAYTAVRSLPYLWRGLTCLLRRKLEVEVLDALSIGVSMLRGDFSTAGSVMFLLRLGELLEEWTRKKSLSDLARCMSLNVDRVWQQTAEGEVLVPISQVRPGDAVVVHTGSVIPLDGRVLEGEASVNQASLTGEAEPVRKSTGAVVYAGTVVEEGQLVMTVEQQAGNGRYDQIPFITAYNIISSIFRGMGDSKSPMYFIAVACVANIILDYIFIGLCHFGPAGAALGTTVSQAISVIVSLFVIVKRKTGISLKPSDFRPKRNVCGTILKIGIPIACQDGLIQIAFIIITIIANKRGLTDSAAVGIVEKVISFLFLVPSSMLSTVSALGAQNIGAGKPERAKLTLRYAIFITAGFGLIVAIIIQFIAEPVVGLFTTDNGGA